MKQLTIERFAYTPMGTFGRLLIDGRFVCLTIEEVWRNNLPSIPGRREGSCIPIGPYRIRRGNFPTHKDTFEVLNVPGRTAILFHIANTVDDIEGCIGPGMRLGCLGGQWGVLDSGEAYRLFKQELAGQDEALLSIVNDNRSGLTS